MRWLALFCLLGPAAAQERFPDVRRAAPELPERSLRAGIVAVEGVFNTELVAPYDVFEHVQYALEAGHGVEVCIITADGLPVRTAEGLRVEADFGFDDAPALDILIVPSAENSTDSDLENDALLAFVRARAARARVVLSLSWGAYVLAEAGLLDGHRATTFPASNRMLAADYPEVEVVDGPGFIHDGRFLTSIGGVPSYEAALYLVDHLYGEDVAVRVGAGLLVSWPPPLHPGAGLVLGD